MNDFPTIENINKALDKLRPYLKNDGGDVEVVRVTQEGIIKQNTYARCLYDVSSEYHDYEGRHRKNLEWTPSQLYNL